jgi:putative ABC transport system permease protein
MTRRQLRSTIRWESVITALLGTALGMAVGLFFGWVLVQALASEGLNVFRIPWASMIVIAVLSAAVGVLAAVFPARRAARLDVLESIAVS